VPLLSALDQQLIVSSAAPLTSLILVKTELMSQFMGIGWVSFPVADEMWDLLDKGGPNISCTRLLQFPDTSHEFVLR